MTEKIPNVLENIYHCNFTWFSQLCKEMVSYGLFLLIRIVIFFLDIVYRLG